MYQSKGLPRLRALHTSPDAPSVDVYIDDSPAVTALSFGQLSNYAELSAGSHNVKIFGSSAGGRGSAVLDANIALDGGKDYTVAAVGLLEHIDAVLLKDSTMMPSEHQAKVRMFHASPDAPSVDIGVSSGPVLFRDIRFKQATDFASVEAGTYNLEVRTTGAITGASGIGSRAVGPGTYSPEVYPTGSTESVLAIPGVALNAGNTYTFVALGLLSGTPPFRVLSIVDRIMAAMPVA